MSLEVDAKVFSAKKTIMTNKDLFLHLENLVNEKIVQLHLLSKEFISSTTIAFVQLNELKTPQEALNSRKLVQFKTKINGLYTWRLFELNSLSRSTV